MIRFPALPAVLLTMTALTGCQVLQPPVKTTDTPAASHPANKTVKPKPEAEEVASHHPEKPIDSTVTVKQTVVQVPARIDGKLVLGFSETGTLTDYGLDMEAKIDTGAVHTSLDARNYEFFERDGKRWVRFDIPRTSKGNVKMELPVKDTILIKRPGEEPQERPVVMMNIRIGNITQLLKITLNDRTRFDFPLLIGRDFLRDMAVADVGKNHIARDKVLETVAVTVPSADKNKVEKTVQKPVSTQGLELVGELEMIKLAGIKSSLKARIDTGAKTSSLDARDIEVYEKGGVEWVRFNVVTPEETIKFDLPSTRRILIKRHGQLESERRWIVSINTTIGHITKPTEYTLRDRSSYDYPILIGERFLTDTALVDVAKEYVTNKSKRDTK